MQEHRTAERAASAASAPPALGTVQGLGLVDALRVELGQPQVPWLIAEMDDLRASFEGELSRALVSYDELPDFAKQERTARARDLEQEVERRAYQLKALAMIRDQIPLGPDDQGGQGDSAPARAAATEAALVSDTPLSLVGPAVLITALLGRSAYRVACRLRCALRREADACQEDTAPFNESHLLSAGPTAIAELHALAAAVKAFTDTLADTVALQAYTFDPEYTPIRSDELE